MCLYECKMNIRYELFQKRQVSTKKQGYGIRESETLTKEELDSLLL